MSRVVVIVLLCCALGIGRAQGGSEVVEQRDPFWPVGYAPAQPEPEVVPEPVVVERVPEKPKPPPEPKIVPVSEEEWAAAGKGLKINGYAKATRPGQEQATAIVMINGRSFGSGDRVSLTNNAVAFTWQIERVTDRDMELLPLTAERLKDAKGFQKSP